MDGLNKRIWLLVYAVIENGSHAEEAASRAVAIRRQAFEIISEFTAPVDKSLFTPTHVQYSDVFVGLCILDEAVGLRASGGIFECGSLCRSFPRWFERSYLSSPASKPSLVELLLRRLVALIGEAELRADLCVPTILQLELAKDASIGASRHAERVVAPLGAVITGTALSNLLWADGSVGKLPDALHARRCGAGPGSSAAAETVAGTVEYDEFESSGGTDYSMDEAEMQARESEDSACMAHGLPARRPLTAHLEGSSGPGQTSCAPGEKRATGAASGAGNTTCVRPDEAPKSTSELGEAAVTTHAAIPGAHESTSGIMALRRACSSGECRRCVLRAPGVLAEQLLGQWGSIAIGGMSRNKAPWHDLCSSHIRNQFRRIQRYRQLQEAKLNASVSSESGHGAGAGGIVDTDAAVLSSGSSVAPSEDTTHDSNLPPFKDEAEYKEAQEYLQTVVRMASAPELLKRLVRVEEDGVEFEFVRYMGKVGGEIAPGVGERTDTMITPGTDVSEVPVESQAASGASSSGHVEARSDSSDGGGGILADALETCGDVPPWRLRCLPEVAVTQQESGTRGSPAAYESWDGGMSLGLHEAGIGIGVFRDFCTQIGNQVDSLAILLEPCTPAMRAAGAKDLVGLDRCVDMAHLGVRVCSRATDGRQLANLGRFFACSLFNGCCIGPTLRLSIPLCCGMLDGFGTDRWLVRLASIARSALRTGIPTDGTVGHPAGKSTGCSKADCEGSGHTRKRYEPIVAIARAACDFMIYWGYDGGGPDVTLWRGNRWVLEQSEDACRELLGVDGDMEGTYLKVPGIDGARMEQAVVVADSRPGDEPEAFASARDPAGPELEVRSQRQFACLVLLRLVRETIGPFPPVPITMGGTGSVEAAFAEWGDADLLRVVASAASSAAGSLACGFQAVVPEPVRALLQPGVLQRALTGDHGNLGIAVRQALDRIVVDGSLSGMGAVEWLMNKRMPIFGISQTDALQLVYDGAMQAVKACIRGEGELDGVVAVDVHKARRLLQFWTGSTSFGPYLQSECMKLGVSLRLTGFDAVAKSIKAGEPRGASATAGGSTSSAGTTLEHPTGFPCRFKCARYPTASTCGLTLSLEVEAIACGTEEPGACTTAGDIPEAVRAALQGAVDEAVIGQSDSGFLLR